MKDIVRIVVNDELSRNISPKEFKTEELMILKRPVLSILKQIVLSGVCRVCKVKVAVGYSNYVQYSKLYTLHANYIYVSDNVDVRGFVIYLSSVVLRALSDSRCPSDLLDVHNGLSLSVSFAAH